MAKKEEKQGAVSSASPTPEAASALAAQESAVKTPEPETKTPAAPVNTDAAVLVASKMQHSVRFSISDNGGIKREFIIAGRNDNLRGKLHGVLNEAAASFTRVPSDAWEKILQKYANFEPLKKGLIWAAKSREDDRPELKTGFEPVDPNKTQTKSFDKKR